MGLSGIRKIWSGPYTEIYIPRSHGEITSFISQIPQTPASGYITEDGTQFYITEDGSSFYITEN